MPSESGTYDDPFGEAMCEKTQIDFGCAILIRPRRIVSQGRTMSRALVRLINVQYNAYPRCGKCTSGVRILCAKSVQTQNNETQNTETLVRT